MDSGASVAEGEAAAYGLASEAGGKPPGPTLVVLQPGYLPWLGYFDQVRRSDIFVHYDSADFDKNGWRNRNRIKGENGEPLWLTVPVHARLRTPIAEVTIDNSSDWRAKHIRSLRQNYRGAPWVDLYLPQLEALLGEPWQSIADLDIAASELLCSWLDIETRFVRSSELDVRGSRNEKLLGLCRHFGASRYLSGAAARAYLDVDLFEREGIEVCWQDYQHPFYPQLHGDFLPYLSALDLLFNCGESSAKIIKGGETGR